MLDTKIKFYKGRVALNVLARDLENALSIHEAAEGHTVVGLLSKNYNTIEEGVKEVKEYMEKLGVVSVGLGAGDPSQFEKAALIASKTDPGHVNQVFTGAGYAAGALKANGFNRTYINVLMSPTGQPGKVKINTGELSSKENDAVADIDTAVAMLKDMRAHSVKFFPMEGLKGAEELKEVVKASEKAGLELIEPTGGIDLENFEEIMKICLDSNIPRVMPHIYGSIIDKETGLTRIEDIRKLYEIVKKLV
jgi:2-dehydro-3-deoxy-phosphogluconate aldolase